MPTVTRADSTRLTAGFRALRSQRELLAVVGVYAVQTVVAGGLTVFNVVLALQVFDLGNAGVGYLDSAFGVGGIIGGVLAAGLAGSRRLGAWFALGAMVWGVGIALVGVSPTATDRVHRAGGRGCRKHGGGRGRHHPDSAGRTGGRSGPSVRHHRERAPGGPGARRDPRPGVNRLAGGAPRDRGHRPDAAGGCGHHGPPNRAAGRRRPGAGAAGGAVAGNLDLQPLCRRPRWNRWRAGSSRCRSPPGRR